MNNIKKISIIVIIFTLTSLHITSQEVFGETKEELEILFKKGMEHMQNSEYRQSIKIYEEILKHNPQHITTQNMKAISHSNMEEHTKSLLDFYRVLQKDPNNIIALTGMAVGFGNLGEYEESMKYLNEAELQSPNNTIIINYKKNIQDTINKYPFLPTEKPEDRRYNQIGEIPNWVKDYTNWWSMKKINEQVYFQSIKYLIETNYIQIPKVKLFENEKTILDIRQNLTEWSKDQISDEEFFKNVQWLINKKFIDIEKSQEDIDYEEYLFKTHLRKIVKNVNEQTRFIIDSNPSQDVIKKFLRDYVRWNFEQHVEMTSQKFPDPTYEFIDETYHITYKVYINDQPPGLPLDHEKTLVNTFQFWESQELKVNKKDATVKFEVTNLKSDANVWITWVVRDIGEGVLGHAHLGKGVVEVALGDYNCGGNFQLFDTNSVFTIMTHELGHSIGLPHSTDDTNIMYPTYSPEYAYCLLTVS